MKILKSIDDLNYYLKTNDLGPGCFADTGFLYGLTYDDDRLFNIANDVHDLLCKFEISIYTNVISRLELIDLVLRKQVTQGCLSTFNSYNITNFRSEIYKLLKDIRDKDTAAVRKKESYKIDERRLKQIRKNINHFSYNDSLRVSLDTSYFSYLTYHNGQHVECFNSHLICHYSSSLRYVLCLGMNVKNREEDRYIIMRR